MPVEKTPKGPVQPPPLPKLSGKKAVGQISLLLVGPALLMFLLSQIWK